MYHTHMYVHLSLSLYIYIYIYVYMLLLSISLFICWLFCLCLISFVCCSCLAVYFFANYATIYHSHVVVFFHLRGWQGSRRCRSPAEYGQFS